jgi:hypothetical protein
LEVDECGQSNNSDMFSATVRYDGRVRFVLKNRNNSDGDKIYMKIIAFNGNYNFVQTIFI